MDQINNETKYDVTAELFVKMLRGEEIEVPKEYYEKKIHSNYYEVICNNLSISDSIEKYSTINTSIHRINISNSIFNKEIELNGEVSSHKKLIYLNNCEFKGDFNIKFDLGYLNIKKTKFNESATISGSVDSGSYSDIIVNKSFKLFSYYASNKMFEKRGPYNNYLGEYMSSTEFENVVVGEDFIFPGADFGQLLFNNIKVKQNIWFGNLTISGDFIIDNLEARNFDLYGQGGRDYFSDALLSNIDIKNSIITNTLSLRCRLKKGFNIQESQISKIDLILFSCIGGLVLSRSSINDIYLRSFACDRLSIQQMNDINLVSERSISLDDLIFDGNKKGTMRISNTSLNNIILKGVFYKDFELQFNNIETNQIIFSNFINLGLLSFNSTSFTRKYLNIGETENGYLFVDEIDSTKNSMFELSNSDLGKTFFTNCDLRNVDGFLFRATRLTDVSIFGTQFPGKLSHDIPKKELNFFYQQKLAYSQLKKIHENRGDTVEALKYSAFEMDSYKSWLDIQNGNLPEKIVLFLNKHTNYYGTEWGKSLKWLLCVSILCYTIYCLLYGFRIQIPDVNGDWTLFGKLATFLPEYIIPIRKSNFLEEFIDKEKPFQNESFPSIARAWDYFSRIVISFLLYQFIQAFRKHGRR